MTMRIGEVLTMDEYLSKETLQEKLNRKKAGPANKRYTEGWNDAVLMVKSMIHSEKAADVAPVRHGRWGTHSDRPDSLICSVCNCGFDMWKHDPHNYCPNCGCRMDLEG